MPALVQDLVDEGIAEVPKAFLFPQDGRAVEKLGADQAVPTLDLSLLADPAKRPLLVSAMADASFQWGFFQVVNHGISLELLSQAQAVSKAFFQLPSSEKMKCAVTKELGQEFLKDGYGSKLFSSDDKAQLWRDYMHLKFLPPSHRNFDNWPSKPEEYRDTMWRLAQAYFELAQKVLELLSEGLGLAPSFLRDAFGEPHQSFMSNYYPPCPSPELVMGFMPHSDFGGLTLLLQDDVPGLQVLKDDKWFTIEPVHGAITINISDQLELLTNGRYRSVTHRVMVNDKKPRLSIASNYTCAHEVLVSPAPELIDDEHPALYRPVVFGDYIKEVAKKGPYGKAYMRITYSE